MKRLLVQLNNYQFRRVNKQISFVQKYNCSDKNKQNIDGDYDLTKEDIDKFLMRGNQSFNQSKKQIQLSDTEEEDMIIIQQQQQELKIKTQQKIERMVDISSQLQTQGNKDEQQQQQQTQEYSQYQSKEVQSQVKYMKYGLPIPNIDPGFKGLEQILEEERLAINTPHENLLQLLQLDLNSSYQQYEQQVKAIFNNEQDMYGDILDEEQLIESRVQQLGECGVPMQVLNDSEYMEYVRSYYSLNISLPGVIETEHPNRFIQHLRPIEQFRNTPLIPVSDAEMRRWKDKLEEYHRNIFYFEIKKETIFNYMIFIVILYCTLFLIKVALDKQDEMGIAYQRLQLERIKYN